MVPVRNCLKRAFNISYYQGQKQAIEALQNIVASEENEEVLKRLLNDYAGQFANFFEFSEFVKSTRCISNRFVTSHRQLFIIT